MSGNRLEQRRHRQVPVHPFAGTVFRAAAIVIDGIFAGAIGSTVEYERVQPRAEVASEAGQRFAVADWPASRIGEHNLAAWRPLAAEATFMDCAMMMSAEQDQIVERCLAAVCPMADVVPIDKTRVRATRETAAAVPAL